MAKVDHVAAVVRNLDNVIRVLTEAFGFQAGPITEVPALGVRNVFLDGENVKVELIEPTGPGPYQELAEKGFIGFNHIALSVEDFDSILERLNRIGVKPKGQAITTTTGSVWDLDPGTAWGVSFQLFKNSS